MVNNNALPEKKRRNKTTLFVLAFITALLLIAATYAWLSSALNVKIHFFEMNVASDSGLFISLDGIDFSDSVTISNDSVIVDLKETYPNHTNQWAIGGLWPVSSNGIKSSNNDKFEFYTGHLLRTKLKNPNGSVKRLLNTLISPENEPTSTNSYIAFDIFLKNQTGSPKPDNLYIQDTTYIDFEEGVPDDTKEAMSGIMNSIRVGIVRIGSVPIDNPVPTIQNVGCNNSCLSLIWEPFYEDHSAVSIENAQNYSINLINGIYNPTYGIIAEGNRLEHTNGHAGTGIPLITSHFALQNTIKNFDNPIFQVPSQITKARVYIWLEGQDIDSLETYSKGSAIDISLDFEKDTAGYE